MKRYPWDLAAPIVLLGIGAYRLANGDLLLSLLSLTPGVTCLVGGILSRYRRF